MIVLKVISIIYTALVLLYYIHFDCKSKDVGESIDCKIVSLLQAGTLAYIIMN